MSWWKKIFMNDAIHGGRGQTAKEGSHQKSVISQRFALPTPLQDAASRDTKKRNRQ
jgi:hypothetical protein